MPRVLVAPDSFKGTYSATEVADAIACGLSAGGAESDLCPVSDGGEGTLEILIAALGGSTVGVRAHDALGREITAEIGLASDASMAIVEMARASGLALIDIAERDPEAASTFGTGELIAAGAATGAERIIVTIGGSATSDGGSGALEAIAQAGGIGDAQIICFCDVETPFEHAAEVFGPQKGADAGAVKRLTKRLAEKAEGFPRDPRGVPGTGAGGGISGALWAVHGAELQPGAPWILDALEFDERLARADAVICGEGHIDTQTLSGKIIGEIARRAADSRVPLHAVVGSNSLSRDELDKLGIVSLHEATDQPAMQFAGAAIAGRPDWRRLMDSDLPVSLTGTRATAVAAELRGLIQSGELAPGTRLLQTEVARRFGVSTTPVREAFTSLARQGLIKHDTHRGAIVFLPSIEDVRENYEIRIALEPLAAKLAAANLQAEELDAIDAIVSRLGELWTEQDDYGDVPLEYVVLDGRLHHAIVIGSQRPRLTEIIDALRDTADGYPQVAAARVTAGFMKRSQSDHEAIARALRDRDEVRAAELVGDHLRFALSRLR